MSDVREIMPRVSRVLAHLSLEEVQQKIKTATSFRRQQKWLIVYNALVDPREAAQIALHTGTTERTVHQVISDYNRSWCRSDRDSRKRRKTAWLSVLGGRKKFSHSIYGLGFDRTNYQRHQD